jgi:holo-ACP synthase CitX
MAPSSTPSDASRLSVLAARDARQLALERHLGAPGTSAGFRRPARALFAKRNVPGRSSPATPLETLVAVSLAVPGPDKTPPGADALFAWAVAEARFALDRARVVHASRDALGPFTLLRTRAGCADAKARCVTIEAARSAARLVDLDVYSPDGASLDRTHLGLPPRACLCCPEPAHECVRARRHDPDLVARAARALLARAGP